MEAAGEKGSRLPGARRALSAASAQLTPSVVTATPLSVERTTSDTERTDVLTRASYSWCQAGRFRCEQPGSLLVILVFNNAAEGAAVPSTISSVKYR